LFSVNVAPCVLLPKMIDECVLVERCSYFNALNDILLSKFRITNYSKYLTLPEHAKCCDILICDEASEVEDVVINFYTLNINYKKLFHYGIDKYDKLVDKDNKSTKAWLTSLYTNCLHQFEKISRDIKNEIHSANHIRGELDRMSGIKNLLEKIQITLENWAIGNYVVTKDQESCQFVPLHAKNLTDILFKNVNHVIFLSGTIYDCKTFTRNLGIKTYKYIEHPGVFDPGRSPVYSPCKVSVNHSNLESSLRVIKAQIIDICNMFPKSKGVIHTHTNKITQWLQQNLSDSRMLYRTGHSTNEHILHDHVNSSDPTILVSPSLVFGVDLPDDLCRFQIIVKLPYPSLGDKRIKTLANQDPDWYQSKMYTKVIQMCGRGSRNEHDTCATFILDGNFIRVTKQNWDKIPLWFRDRLK
jgi:ATP-dependent DNA helicase DinG